MEILLFGDPKFFKTQDLPERAVQAMSRWLVIVNDIQSRADQSAFQSDGLKADLSVHRFHRRFEPTAKVLLAPNRESNAVGAAGIRDVDEVIDIFIEHAFDATGVPGLLSGFQYRGDDLDIDGLRISVEFETFLAARR
jgi:hypothetical protein